VNTDTYHFLKKRSSCPLGNALANYPEIHFTIGKFCKSLPDQGVKVPGSLFRVQHKILISMNFGVSVFVTPSPRLDYDGTGWSTGVLE
jgi:hypothetical protein